MGRLPRARLLLALAALAALALTPSLGGCASSPVASWQGARLYVSGSQALEAGRTDEAVRDLERAAELAPQASEIQNHLGAAYAAQGRDAEALVAFERAVELDCDNDAAQQNLRAARSAAATNAP